MSIVIIVLLTVVVLAAVIALIKAVRIVPQSRAGIVERLGKYQSTLNPGLHFLIPFIDRLLPLIDLREQVVPFPAQSVITEDNLVVGIDTVVYFQVTDPRAATYEITNYIQAVDELTSATLRNVVGGLNLEETLTSRDKINAELRGVLDSTTGRWGIRISRVDIKEITPPPSIQDSMEKQMRAERDRRAAILTAEGTKQAAILTAEGERQSQILSAEGEAQARVLRANAEAEAIEVVFDAIHSGGADSEVLAYQYLQSLPKIADGQANTMFVVPAELTRALQGLGEAFAPGDGDRPTPERAPRRRDSGDRAGEPGAEHSGVTPERARRPRGSRPTTADALRASGVMDAMTAGAVTAEDMPQTSLDEALATPVGLEDPLPAADPERRRGPGMA